MNRPPFLAAMLAAVRCAFRYVASIITVFASSCSLTKPTIIWAKMPFSLQRLPAAVERLVRAVGGRSVTPTQPIAIDEDNPTQHPSVIDPRKGGKLGHLLVGQPEKVAHVTAPLYEP